MGKHPLAALEHLKFLNGDGWWGRNARATQVPVGKVELDRRYQWWMSELSLWSTTSFFPHPHNKVTGSSMDQLRRRKRKKRWLHGGSPEGHEGSEDNANLYYMCKEKWPNGSQVYKSNVTLYFSYSAGVWTQRKLAFKSIDFWHIFSPPRNEQEV